jgi:hypothetical protein
VFSPLGKIYLFDLHIIGATHIFLVFVSYRGRASGNLMDEVTKFIAATPGAKERICRSRAEQLFIAQNKIDGTARGSNADAAADLSTTSKLYSYPSSRSGTTYNTTHAWVGLSPLFFYINILNGEGKRLITEV